MTHFVSIVVPTRNRAALLRDCLESLIAQEYPRECFEVIVVDDGSMDETTEVAGFFSERIAAPRVRLVRKPPGGLNSARNAGIAIARGDPICLVDDDVATPAGWLQAMVAGSLRYPDAGCLGGAIRLRLEGRPPRLCGREPIGETELDLGPEDRDGVLVWGANMAIRRAALELVGLFDTGLSGPGDEQEWEERLLERGGRVVYIAEAWLWHRRTAVDLQFLRMLKRRFARGAHVVPYRRARGGPTPRVGNELVAATRVLGHALLHRCAWGVLAAAAHLGAAWATLSAGDR